MIRIARRAHADTLSRIYRGMLQAILALVLLFGVTAAFWSYSIQKTSILTQTETTLNDVLREYESIEKNFWSVYIPVFEDRTNYEIIYAYFRASAGQETGPIELKRLGDAVRKMMNRDTRIAWIALYAPSGQSGYVLLAPEESLVKMDDDFPFLPELAQKRQQQELYGAKTVYSAGKTFAISGGVPPEMGAGSVVVGYHTGKFDQLIQASPAAMGADYAITTADAIVFDSTGEYDMETLRAEAGSALDPGSWTYTREIVRSGSGYTVSYRLPWWNLLVKANRYTPAIALGTLALWLLALLFYQLFTARVFRQVEQIKQGLEKLGDSNLDYRLPAGQYAGELGSISRSVNRMAAKLERHIESEYLSSLKQKEAELAELQSKFDPHFLYNALEIIRGRLYETGDTETAEMIKKLSQLFRSFISNRRFVTIQDELAFCSSYFSLFQTPDSESIQVTYDVDSELLLFGIIRNLLQPLVENYLVHGFDRDCDDNCIHIRCSKDGDAHICIQIIDNGLGISDDRLTLLEGEIRTGEVQAPKSYGLINLSRRIRLFYGEDCALRLEKNRDRGVCITLCIRKMSIEEHESAFHRMT